MMKVSGIRNWAKQIKLPVLLILKHKIRKEKLLGIKIENYN
jgi:hypothetical protein